MSTLTLSCMAADVFLPGCRPFDEDELHLSSAFHAENNFETDMQHSPSESSESTDLETMYFAEQMLDRDFVMLEKNSLTLPIEVSASNIPVVPSITPVNRKRPIWKNAKLTEEFLLKKSVKLNFPSIRKQLSKEDQYIDIINECTGKCASPSSSLSSPRSEVSSSGYSSDWSSSSQSSTTSGKASYHGYIADCHLGDSTENNRGNKKLYPKTYTIGGSAKEWTQSYHYKGEEQRQDMLDSIEEKLKDGNLSSREEMNLLKLSCTCQSRNTAKNTHLWEFLLEMLADKRMKSIIAWTGRQREFKVINSREIAREWGNRKNKPHMNFDKMSRAMRYYYKKNILTHGNKQRLVYSFCQRAICPHYEKILKLALKTRPNINDALLDEFSVNDEIRMKPSLQSSSLENTWNSHLTNTQLVKTSNSHIQQSKKLLTEKLSSQRLFKRLISGGTRGNPVSKFPGNIRDHRRNPEVVPVRYQRVIPGKHPGIASRRVHEPAKANLQKVDQGKSYLRSKPGSYYPTLNNTEVKRQSAYHDKLTKIKLYQPNELSKSDIIINSGGPTSKSGLTTFHQSSYQKTERKFRKSEITIRNLRIDNSFGPRKRIVPRSPSNFEYSEIDCFKFKDN